MTGIFQFAYLFGILLLVHSYWSCTLQRDIVFVVDGSGSISSLNWRNELTFVSNVINQMNITATNSRVALVQYGTTAEINSPYGFGFTSNVNQILNYLSTLSQLVSLTNTRAGLKKARQYMELQGRPNAEKMIILLSEGLPNEPCACDTCLIYENGCTAASINRVSRCFVNPDAYLLPVCRTPTANCSSCSSSAGDEGCMTCATPLPEVNLIREYGWSMFSFGIITFSSSSFLSYVASLNIDNKFYGANWTELPNNIGLLASTSCQQGNVPTTPILPPPILVANVTFTSIVPNNTVIQVQRDQTDSTKVLAMPTQTLTIASVANLFQIEIDTSSSIRVESNSSETVNILNELQSISITVQQQELNLETFSGVTLPSMYDVIDPSSRQVVGQVIGNGLTISSSTLSSRVRGLNGVSMCIQVSNNVKTRSSQFTVPEFVRRAPKSLETSSQLVQEFVPWKGETIQMEMEKGGTRQKMCARFSVPTTSSARSTDVLVFPALLQNVPTPTATIPPPDVSSSSVTSFVILVLALPCLLVF